MKLTREAMSQSVAAKASSQDAKRADKSALRSLDFAAGEKMLSPAVGAQPRDAEEGVDSGLVKRAIAYNQKAKWAKKPQNIATLQSIVSAPVTRAWDEATVKALLVFQAQKGIEVDGKVGALTRDAVQAEMGGGARPRGADEGDAEPAQLQEVTPESVPSPVASTPVAGEVSASQSASGPLAPKQVAAAQAIHRKSPFAPAWVVLLQAALGTGATGVLDSATIQRLAEFQSSQGLGVTGALNRGTLSKLHEVFPSLAQPGGERTDLDPKGKSARAKTSSDPSEDEAARKEGYKSMKDYISTLQNGAFLGDRVVGHGNFLARLRAAEGALKVQFPGMEGNEIGERLGSSVTNSYRPSQPGKPQFYHGIGQAIDINKRNNPWVVGNPQAKQANKGTVSIIQHACEFMGIGEALSPGVLHQWAQDLPTEELWAKIQESNQALIQYRTMAKDPAAIAAQFRKRQASDKPMTGERAQLSYWQRKVPWHDEMLRKDKSNWKGSTKNLGFMDHSKVLMSALRDAGGLAWGGTDMSERQSSDMMHFDNRNDGTAKALMSQIKSSRARNEKKEAGKSEE